jgi:hypothetical protein
MPHTIAYHPEQGIIEVKFHGEIRLNETREIFSDIIPIVEEHDCNLILSDYREASIKLSTGEIYEVPNTLSKMFAASRIPANRLKRALVMKNDLNDFHFFENVTINRGQNAKVFTDIEEARKWLLGK